MLRRLSLSLLLLAFACLTAAPAAHAQGRPPEKAKNGPQTERERDRDHDEDRDSDRNRVRQKGVPVFTARDRDIIREFFRGGYSNLPPGLAKRHGNLPPGLQKQIECNGTLPPGLQKRLTPFPSDLERRLSSISDIYRRGTIGESVVLIDRRTQRVIDVIHDIVRP